MVTVIIPLGESQEIRPEMDLFWGSAFLGYGAVYNCYLGQAAVSGFLGVLALGCTSYDIQLMDGKGQPHQLLHWDDETTAFREPLDMAIQSG